MADIDTDLVVLALTVAVSKQTHFCSIRNNTLDLDSDLVFRTMFFAVAKSVVDHFVVESLRQV